MSKKSTLKKTLLAVAIAAALGTSAAASADTINMSWNGAFTMLDPSGRTLSNPDAPGAPWFGRRTAVTGTLTYDDVAKTGGMVVTPFSFFGSGLAKATTITLQAIGNGSGGPGTLMLGNMGFNWNSNAGIPVSIVWDATGLFNAIQAGVSTGQVISGSGALPASNDIIFGRGTAMSPYYTLPLGPAPVATTTWNTSNLGTVVLGTNPSGTLPLIADTTVDKTNNDIGLGGSPMPTAPFRSFNADFDMTSLTVTSVAPVPIPAAAWLFGSGLLGLVGVARRRRNES